MSQIPEPTGAYKEWLEQECLPEDKRGKPERTNRDFVLGLWSNPWMIDEARKIFEAGQSIGKATTLNDVRYSINLKMAEHEYDEIDEGMCAALDILDELE